MPVLRGEREECGIVVAVSERIDEIEGAGKLLSRSRLSKQGPAERPAVALARSFQVW